MNGDKIRVVAVKLESAQQQRRRTIRANIRSLRCLNKVLMNGNGHTATEKFTDSLQKLLD